MASFAMAPRRELVQRLKDGGVVVIPSIGAKRHAEKVAEWGVDAVLVQGGEGGGHTGSVPTTLLLPQVVDAVDIPVIAAGGFFDGRGLVAALAYGAAGIAMGTRFLLTQESQVPQAVKDVYLSKSVTDTVVTTQVDGWPHRVLRTPFVEHLEHTGRVTALPRALKNAVAFQRLSGTPWREMVGEGLAMRKAQELSWSPGRHGGQHAHAVEEGHGRRPARPGRDGQWPGGGVDRRAADGGGADHADHEGGGRGVGEVGRMTTNTRVPAVEGWFTMDEAEPALLGNRCTWCGTVFFPKASFACRNPSCDGTEFEEVPLSRRGRVWSYDHDHYAPPALRQSRSLRAVLGGGRPS